MAELVYEWLQLRKHLLRSGYTSNDLPGFLDRGLELWQWTDKGNFNPWGMSKSLYLSLVEDGAIS